MGCQITKEEDEKRSDQQSNTEHATDTQMAQKTTAATDYKSRLEWKLCLVCHNVSAFCSLIRF